MEKEINILFSIDIGSKGGLSYFKNNKYVYSKSFDLKLYSNLFRDLQPDIVVIEKVHSMPSQGVKSMFSFGQRLGEIIGLCYANNIKQIFIEPREWIKYFKLEKTDKKDKANLAILLEPKITNYIYGKRGGLLDGISDSYLIGKYYIERFLND